MAYLVKNRDQILLTALRKLSTKTPITNTGPGSVARALTEVITTELGDMYDILNFNMTQSVISTASGRALEVIGSLFNVPRKRLTDTAAIDKTIGAFYFYLDHPFGQPITIPVGTLLYTDIDTYTGSQFSYATVEDVVIPAGRTRMFASIRPMFADTPFTAGPGTITVIDPGFTQPVGATVKATNPKPISVDGGYEDDTNYRIRLINAVRTTAGGTLASVRFAGLNVAGVRDVAIRNTPYGMGSFEALVVTEDNLTNGPALLGATRAMDSVRPVGVRMYVRQPDYLPVDVQASIVIRDNIVIDSQNVARRVEVGIVRYLNTLLVGTPLIYNQLVQAILDATDVVTDVTITRYAVNGVETLRQNYTPDSDQQIIPGEVRVSVAS